MSLLKRWFSRQQKQISQNDIKALMQGDLARAGIKAGPYLEEPPMPRPPLEGQIRDIVPPGSAWTRLNSYRFYQGGQWQIQIQIHFKARRPSLSFIGEGSLLIMFETNQSSFLGGSVNNGKTGNLFKNLLLAASDVLNLYVVHDSPYPAEVEYSVSFTQVDKGA